MDFRHKAPRRLANTKNRPWGEWSVQTYTANRRPPTRPSFPELARGAAADRARDPSRRDETTHRVSRMMPGALSEAPATTETAPRDAGELRGQHRAGAAGPAKPRGPGPMALPCCRSEAPVGAHPARAAAVSAGERFLRALTGSPRRAYGTHWSQLCTSGSPAGRVVRGCRASELRVPMFATSNLISDVLGSPSTCPIASG